VSREHAFAPHRVAILATVAVLAAVALLAVYGPAWWQRAYHPLAYRDEIARSAVTEEVDPYLIAAVVNVESGFDPARVSKAGAVGLMQVLPATADEVFTDAATKPTTERLHEPAYNIAVGTRYLHQLLSRYHGDVGTALAAYNGGATNADRWVAEAKGGDVQASVGFPVTKRYVADVLAQREAYRKLYPDAFPEVSQK
jgi:soluble lytic murein transglycosylase